MRTHAIRINATDPRKDHVRGNLRWVCTFLNSAYDDKEITKKLKGALKGSGFELFLFLFPIVCCAFPDTTWINLTCGLGREEAPT